MDDSSQLYSIVVPVYNEADVISSSVEAIELYLDGLNLNYEIILVDDGSGDDTAGVIRRRLSQDGKIRFLQNPRNEGKGVAVKLGVFGCCGDYIMFMDADLSVPLGEISKILKCVKAGADIVIGVRDGNSKLTSVKRPVYRRMISFLYNAFCNQLFFKGKIIDIGCGFKLFKRDVALDLFSNMYIKSWVFDVEIISRAMSDNYKIEQVAVNWVFKGRSKLNIFKDLIVATFGLLRLKLFLMRSQKDLSCE